MAKSKSPPAEAEPVPDLPCDGFELIHGGIFKVPGFLKQLDDPECEHKHAEVIRRACELRDATNAFRDRLASYPREPRASVLFGVETRLQKLDLFELESAVHREVAEMCEFLARRTDELHSECARETREAREGIESQMFSLGAEGHFVRETARRNPTVVSLAQREQRVREFLGAYRSAATKHARDAGWCDARIEEATREISHGSVHEVIVSAGEAAAYLRKHNGEECYL